MSVGVLMALPAIMMTDNGGNLVLVLALSQAREEAIARGEDPDAAEALILNGGVAPVAVVKEPEPPQTQTTGLEGAGLGIDADVSGAFISIYTWNNCAHRTVLFLCPPHLALSSSHIRNDDSLICHVLFWITCLTCKRLQSRF